MRAIFFAKKARRNRIRHFSSGEREVGRARLELATNALKGRCSTIELPTLPQKGTREVTWSGPRSKCELHEVARLFTAGCAHAAPNFSKSPPQCFALLTRCRGDHCGVVWMEAGEAVAFSDEPAGFHAANCDGEIGVTLAFLQ